MYWPTHWMGCSHHCARSLRTNNRSALGCAPRGYPGTPSPDSPDAMRRQTLLLADLHLLEWDSDRTHCAAAGSSEDPVWASVVAAAECHIDRPDRSGCDRSRDWRCCWGRHGAAAGTGMVAAAADNQLAAAVAANGNLHTAAAGIAGSAQESHHDDKTEQTAFQPPPAAASAGMVSVPEWNTAAAAGVDVAVDSAPQSVGSQIHHT